VNDFIEVTTDVRKYVPAEYLYEFCCSIDFMEGLDFVKWFAMG
jgi:hypothetical protein